MHITDCVLLIDVVIANMQVNKGVPIKEPNFRVTVMPNEPFIQIETYPLSDRIVVPLRHVAYMRAQ